MVAIINSHLQTTSLESYLDSNIIYGNFYRADRYTKDIIFLATIPNIILDIFEILNSSGYCEVIQKLNASNTFCPKSIELPNIFEFLICQLKILEEIYRQNNRLFLESFLEIILDNHDLPFLLPKKNGKIKLCFLADYVND